MSHVVINKFQTTIPRDYTPDLLDATNITINYCKWYRQGRYMYINALLTWTGSGVGGNPFSFGLPTGYVMDTNYLVGGTGTTNANASVVGDSQVWNPGGSWTMAPTKFLTTTKVQFTSGGAYYLGTTFTNGFTLQVNVKVPILGWS